MTYRSDSDIHLPYYQFANKLSTEFWQPGLGMKWRNYEDNFTDEKLLASAKLKKKNVVAVISHCQSTSYRATLIEELRKFIDVDVYGRCGSKK